MNHSEEEIFTIYVLWLTGFSQALIARYMRMRVKQVAGIVTHSEYTNRAAMTDAERQTYLDELREVHRQDPVPSPILDRVSWKVLPLSGRQLRRA
ncbi:MAG: hypothetical protein KDJ63_00035 [Nitratireductor sp.]|nr:hypothetical protein [Nitratireductor sp.]